MMIKEENILIESGDIVLEGLYARGEGASGAVIAHPHPLRGGDMRNPVVEAMAESFHLAGFSTLRFNFRGVGESTGAFDEGRGEKDDVLAAASFLKEKGCKEILLAGYSFGAWMIAGVLPFQDYLPAVLVSPPLALWDFNLPSLRGKVGLIIVGDHDQFCPTQMARDMAAELSCPLEVVGAADHFFFGKRKELHQALHRGRFW